MTTTQIQLPPEFIGMLKYTGNPIKYSVSIKDIAQLFDCKVDYVKWFLQCFPSLSPYVKKSEYGDYRLSKYSFDESFLKDHPSLKDMEDDSEHETKKKSLEEMENIMEIASERITRLEEMNQKLSMAIKEGKCPVCPGKSLSSLHVLLESHKKACVEAGI